MLKVFIKIHYIAVKYFVKNNKQTYYLHFDKVGNVFYFGKRVNLNELNKLYTIGSYDQILLVFGKYINGLINEDKYLISYNLGNKRGEWKYIFKYDINVLNKKLFDKWIKMK